MLNKRTLLIGAGLLLTLVSATVWASHPKIVWTPPELIPDSIAPGESRTFQLTLANASRKKKIETKHLTVEARGDIVPFVTIVQPQFPKKLLPRQSVTVSVTVAVPDGTPLSVVGGDIALVKREIDDDDDDRDGKREVEIKTFKRTLPVELTFSSFPLPPAPDPAEDQATILGIDHDADGVPDRVNRWIGFEAPTSEKLRVALTLSAKAQQDFFKDYLAHAGEDPDDEAVRARVLALAYAKDRANNCLAYTQGAHGSFTIPGMREKWEAYAAQSRELYALFEDTKERMDAFTDSERPLVATGLEKEVITDEQYRQECLDLGFDPDILPN